MPKILRKTSIQFGGTGPVTSFGQFGSKQAGLPQTSQDPTVIQGLAAWVNGWQNAVVTGNKAAYLEDMNGWCFVQSYMVSYILQQGIPEWDTNTTYYANSVVQGTTALGNAGQWFNSLTDNNLGNAPPVGASNAQWEWINPPTPVDGGLTVTSIPKVSTAGPAVLIDSAIKDTGVNVELTLPLKFSNGSIQTVAASPISQQSVVTGSKTAGVTYQNLTGKVLFVNISIGNNASQISEILCDAALNPTTRVAYCGAPGSSNDYSQMCIIVLPNYYYKLVGASTGILAWVEYS